MRRLHVTLVFVAMIGAYAALYSSVFPRLVHDWLHDDNYSHGILIVPLALYFAWERRERLTALEPAPRLLGLGVVAAGLAILLAGLLGAELFLARVSMIVTLVGGVLFVLGWKALKVLAFPIAFLLLMIPIPAIIFNQIAFPLQLLASQVGEAGLSAVGVPVLREGNVMILAHTTLEVAEACSGIRSLISLLTLGIVFGYFTDPRGSIRTLIALTTIPVAILTNGLRVAGTGVAAHYIGPEAAQGFFHTFSGWLVFILAFILMFGAARLLIRLKPLPTGTLPAAAWGLSAMTTTTRLVVLALVFGLTAGYVAFAMEPERVPLREPFANMDTHAGRWRLDSTPKIDDKVLAVLGVDDYVNRIYRASANEALSLYVGYYQSQREGDTIHSPMNCLPGAGWIPMDTRMVDVPISGRAPIRVKRVVIAKGLERQLVLYWYQSHGRVVANEYWSKVTMVYDAVRLNRSDAALVRVITPLGQTASDEQAADARIVDFVQALFPQLESHLPS